MFSRIGALAPVVLLVASQVHAQVPTEHLTVTPNMSYGWTIVNQTTAASTFVDGLSAPGAGQGSLSMTTGTGDPSKAPAGGKSWFFNGSYHDVPLAQLTSLKYAAYSETSATVVPGINIAVDFLGDGASYTILVFEPVYSGIPVVQGQWQEWNTLAGKWWSTKTVGPFCAFECYFSLADFIAAYPDAKIRSAETSGGDELKGIQFLVGQNSAGHPWANYRGAIDRILIGVGHDGDPDQSITEYDLELYSAPTTADDCRNGGYKTFNPAFKNQGQCVASVVSTTP